MSGEDAPDLVATAPVQPTTILSAKFVAVLATVAVPVLPFALALAWLSPALATLTVAGAAAATGSAFLIQHWFRQPGRRSQFRRRQTASRIATFAEAFSSIGWAATAALASVSLPLGAITGIVAVLALLAIRLARPRLAW